MSSVSVSRASSSSRVRSAVDRVSRDTSNPNTAPTSPKQTRETTYRNPSRPSVDRPETPRSASMTCTDPGGHPNAAAWSANAYCRAVDSVCSRTCASVDCRTYTNATRSR